MHQSGSVNRQRPAALRQLLLASLVLPLVACRQTTSQDIEQADTAGRAPVSYTHLTLPTKA